jgi:hypothetical protein
MYVNNKINNSRVLSMFPFVNTKIPMVLLGLSTSGDFDILFHLFSMDPWNPSSSSLYEYETIASIMIALCLKFNRHVVP